MVTTARPLGRLAARRPVRRVGGRATPVASVQPGDRTKDGEEVVVAAAADGNAAEEEDTRSDKQKEIDRLKAAEKYVLAAFHRHCAATDWLWGALWGGWALFSGASRCGLGACI